MTECDAEGYKDCCGWKNILGDRLNLNRLESKSRVGKLDLVRENVLREVAAWVEYEADLFGFSGQILL